MHSKKENLRKKLISARLGMNKEEASKKSHIIVQKLLASVDWKKVESLHIYNSNAAWNEVDTKQIVKTVRKNWPRTEITLPENIKNALMLNKQYDLIIVPIVGFDKDNYRLGLGGGWYDRFLADQPRAQTIGLAYTLCEVDILPHESHDISLDKIITEL